MLKVYHQIIQREKLVYQKIKMSQQLIIAIEDEDNQHRILLQHMLLPENTKRIVQIKHE